MKIETPQIFWNNDPEKPHVNAPLLSVSLVESGGLAASQHVLATAGSCPDVRLWRVVVNDEETESSAGKKQPTSTGHKTKKGQVLSTAPRGGGSRSDPSNSTTQLDYLCTLSRHESAVNAVQFSPDGLHLATASDVGAIIVWSVPCHKRGNGNGHHYWSTLCSKDDDGDLTMDSSINKTKATPSQLSMQILPSVGAAVTDLSWSADSKRLLAATLDHAWLVIEDVSYNANHNGNTATTQQEQSRWCIVERNGMDHTQYVQGVAYDPLGVYLATQSSDRTVRVYPRKKGKDHKKLLSSSSSNNKKSSKGNTKALLQPPQSQQPAGGDSAAAPPAVVVASPQERMQEWLTRSSFALGRGKQIRYRTLSSSTEGGGDVVMEQANDAENIVGATSVSGSAGPRQQQKKQALFTDEGTLKSFVRRLAWTADGAYLVTPAALWRPLNDDAAPGNGDAVSSYATCLFARHKFDQPARVLTGLEKPSVAVCPNPVLFELPEEAKENKSPAVGSGKAPVTQRKNASNYRSVFAVLTHDTVLVYDTHHTKPLALVRGLHYSNLSDAAWSADGRTLMVCSTDGYISILRFAPGELGEVYHDKTPSATPVVSPQEGSSVAAAATKATTAVPSPSSAPTVLLPPCEPEDTVEAPPPAKKVRLTPSTTNPGLKRPADDHENVEQAVDKLTLQGGGAEEEAVSLVSKKKKKRVQPVLLSTTTMQQ